MKSSYKKELDFLDEIRDTTVLGRYMMSTNKYITSLKLRLVIVYKTKQRLSIARVVTQINVIILESSNSNNRVAPLMDEYNTKFPSSRLANSNNRVLP